MPAISERLRIIDAVTAAQDATYQRVVAAAERRRRRIIEAGRAEHRPEIDRLSMENRRREFQWLALAEPVWEAIAEDLRDATPHVDDLEWPGPEVDEFPDPLFDSQRSYLRQIARYRRHQRK